MLPKFAFIGKMELKVGNENKTNVLGYFFNYDSMWQLNGEQTTLYASFLWLIPMKT
jgi:hypothetical protein